MISIAIYGKIIIDNIRLADGTIVSGELGGGGPQGAIGARLWNPGVGLLSRVGGDFSGDEEAHLHELGVDITGVQRFQDNLTLRGTIMAYDENEYSVGMEDSRPVSETERWQSLLQRNVVLPETYRAPQAIHLITEYMHDDMMGKATQLKQNGAILSLEPIIDYRNWSNRDEIVSWLPEVDTATPDWPSASGIAGSDDPAKVLHHWSKLGPSLIAIRHGAHGSYVWDSGSDKAWHIPAAKINAVDPTGGGNAYGGGMIAGWLEHGTALEAGLAGTASAAEVVTRVGCPTWQEDMVATAAARREELRTMVEPL